MRFLSAILATLFAAALVMTPVSGSANADQAQSLLPKTTAGQSLMLLADSEVGEKQGSRINPCGLNGRVPCGTTCCPRGYRCGDSKCHKRPVKGVGGSATDPGSTLSQ